MTKLILIRHGESLGNLHHRFLGHTDWDLSPTGYTQAEKAAEYIAAHHPIDAIISSDLLRAYHTALPTAQKTGLSIQKEPLLREIYAGQWEGKTYEELAQEFPPEYTCWKQDIGHARCNGGESTAELCARVFPVLQKLAEENDGKTLLIATHATVLRCLECKWRGLSAERMHTIPWVRNASVSTVFYEDGSWRIEKMGDDSFLGDLSTALSSNV